MAVRPGVDLDGERRRITGILTLAYKEIGGDAQSVVEALRGYNELVTACIAFLLGFAEEPARGPVEVDANQPTTVSVRTRSFRIQLTLMHDVWLANAATFRISDGGPLDGLYLVEGFGVQATGTQVIADRYAQRVRNLERAA